MNQSNEERILNMLAGMQTDIHDLKTDVHDLTTDVQGLKTDVQGLKTDVGTLKTDVQDLKSDVLKINVRLDTDVAVKLDALAEGHASILEQLTPRSRIDDMETEIRFLKTVIRQMGDDIQQLKKAQ